MKLSVHKGKQQMHLICFAIPPKTNPFIIALPDTQVKLNFYLRLNVIIHNFNTFLIYFPQQLESFLLVLVL